MYGLTYYFVSKDTTKKRPGNRSYTIHASNKATVNSCQQEPSGCNFGLSLTSKQDV